MGKKNIYNKNYVQNCDSKGELGNHSPDSDQKISFAALKKAVASCFIFLLHGEDDDLNLAMVAVKSN